jgi:hypothetical protein
MNKRFHWGIPALLLVFVLIFAACEDAVTGTDFPSMKVSNLNITQVKGGALLEWDWVLDSDVRYEIWRNKGADMPEQIGNFSRSTNGVGNFYAYGTNSMFGLHWGTRKYRYYDLVSNDQYLEDGVAYTYTLLATGGGKPAARWKELLR